MKMKHSKVDPSSMNNVHLPSSSISQQLESHNQFFDGLMKRMPVATEKNTQNHDKNNKKSNKKKEEGTINTTKRKAEFNQKTKLKVDEDESPTYNTKYAKGQHKDSKEAKRARLKVSKQEDIIKEEEEEEEVQDAQVQEEDDHSTENEASGDNGNQHPKETPSSSIILGTDTPTNGKSRIEVLKLKLQQKIDSLRSSRSVTTATLPVHTDTASDSKENHPDSTLTKNALNDQSMEVSKRAAKRVEKLRKKSKQMGSTAATSTASSATTVDQTQQQQQHKRHSNHNHTVPITDNTTLLQKISKKLEQEHQKKDSSDNDLSGIDYGTLTGLSSNHQKLHDNKNTLNKSLSNLGKKKSLESLLAQAEKKKERLLQLKQSEKSEDQDQAKKMEWTDTLKLAAGEKNKQSDPALLKKAIKRKAKKKAKSAEAWKVRMNQVKEKMDQRQKIRTHNVQKRKEGGAVGANLSKNRVTEENAGNKEDGKNKNSNPSSTNAKKRPRLGPHSQAGKSRAGFEGKKQGFINNVTKN